MRQPRLTRFADPARPSSASPTRPLQQLAHAQHVPVARAIGTGVVPRLMCLADTTGRLSGRKERMP